MINFLLLFIFITGTDCYSQSQKRVVIYGSDANYPPYEYLNQNNQPEGFNIDVISAIAKEMDFEVKFRLDNWSKIRRRLEVTEEIDVSDMFYSIERDSLVDFSIPFTIAYDEIFVRVEETDINSLEDLKYKSIVVQSSSFISEKIAQLFPEATLITFESEPEALKQLANGIGDCAILSQTVSRSIIQEKHYKNIKRVGSPIFAKEYAFVVKNGNSELISLLNAGLKRIKDNRTLAGIEEKWFGQNEEEFESVKNILNYTLYILIVLLALAGIVLIWSYSLKRQVQIKTSNLTEAHNKLNETITNMDEAFLWLTYDLEIKNINLRAATYYKKDPKQILDKSLSTEFPEFFIALKEHIEKATLNKEFISTEYFSEQINKWFEIRFFPSEYGIAVFAKDITVFKDYLKELTIAKEKAEKSDQLKSEFLAQMSHEIRTPVNNILNYSNLLLETCPNKEEGQLIYNSIDTSGKRILRTIDLLLNMSEIQLGSYTTIVKKIDLNSEVLDHIINEYKSETQNKSIYLRTILLVDKLNVKGDLFCISQIFSNLIDNAVKFTSKGGVEIVFDKNEQNKLTAKISDTGIGISEEFIPKLFDPFSQEEQGYTRSFEGNGIGMALVKKYCEMNDIEIKVESKKNKGTTFTLTFQQTIN